MSIILELWDIHEHNVRVINELLTKNSFLKRFYSLDISSSVLYAFWTFFADSVKLKE